MSGKFDFYSNLTTVTATSHEHIFTVMIISRLFLLRTINIPDIFVQKIETRFIFYNFVSENRAVYEIMWKNIEESDGHHVNIILRMRFACCITKATNTHSQYVLLFHYKNGCMNAPHCYVVRILPALLHFFPLSPLYATTCFPCSPPDLNLV